MIYFAFGSNMDPEQMKVRCPSHKVLGRAYLQDFDLCFPRRSPKRKCGTAGILPAAGKGVWGVLYALKESDLPSLHVAEGYAPGGPPAQNRHSLEEIEVRERSPAGAVISAHIYLPRPDGTGALPSPDYMRHLIDGATHHGLPQAYVETLRAVKQSAWHEGPAGQSSSCRAARCRIG